MSGEVRSIKPWRQRRHLCLFGYPVPSTSFTQRCSHHQTHCRVDRKRHRRSAYACQNQDVKHEVSRRQVLISLTSILASVFLKTRQTHAEDTENNASNDDNNKLVGRMTQSGLRYFDFAEGEGVTPNWGDFVQMHYTLYTISKDGGDLEKGDSTYDRREPYLLHHGNGTTIFGIEEALHSMKVGGRRRIIVPPKLAYVQDGLGPVPPPDWKRRAIAKRLSDGGGVLVFDLEVTKIMKDPYDQGYYQDLTPTPDELLKMFDDIRAKKRAAGKIIDDNDMTVKVL